MSTDRELLSIALRATATHIRTALNNKGILAYPLLAADADNIERAANLIAAPEHAAPPAPVKRSGDLPSARPGSIPGADGSTPSPAGAAPPSVSPPDHGNVSTVGNGKVSVPVSDILSSSKVQRQVEAARELQASVSPQATTGGEGKASVLEPEYLDWLVKCLRDNDYPTQIGDAGLQTLWTMRQRAAIAIDALRHGGTAEGADWVRVGEIDSLPFRASNWILAIATGSNAISPTQLFSALREAYAAGQSAAPRPDAKPIDMLLWCPRCASQHIDAPQPEKNWTNPPHKSHQCQACGHIWRPADVETYGVAAIKTRGKADHPPMTHPAFLAPRPDAGEGWTLPRNKVNSLQADSIDSLIHRCKLAHHVDVVVRINGKDEHYQVDWLKHLEAARALSRPDAGEGLDMQQMRDDARHYEDVIEILMSEGGSIRYDSGNLEWVVERGRERVRARGSLATALEEAARALGREEGEV